MNHFTKLALEAGPLIIFFVANATTDLITATAIFVVATLIALGVSWTVARTVPVIPLVSGVFVVVFGGLTVFLDDALFIKIKPTIVNLLFAGILFTGLATRRNVLKLALKGAVALDDRGWRLLTWRWALFFVLLAGINEFVWRSFESDTWVAFKVWGIMPLTILFSLTQIPLFLRHQLPEDDQEKGESDTQDASDARQT